MSDYSFITQADLARLFAVNKHSSQVYGDKPYSFHLEQVVATLNELWPDSDDDLIAAAWLHDTLEDTNTTYEELVSSFGNGVADLVELVTDKEGKNRAERHRNTYPQISKSARACLIKLADRLANATNAAKEGNERILEMYRKEHPYFQKMIYNKHESFKVAQQRLDELLKEK
jgi:(p)ppGpp synthase/HD superfamily hydrolase